MGKWPSCSDLGSTGTTRQEEPGSLPAPPPTPQPGPDRCRPAVLPLDTGHSRRARLSLATGALQKPRPSPLCGGLSATAPAGGPRTAPPGPVCGIARQAPWWPGPSDWSHKATRGARASTGSRGLPCLECPRRLTRCGDRPRRARGPLGSPRLWAHRPPRGEAGRGLQAGGHLPLSAATSRELTPEQPDPPGAPKKPVLRPVASPHQSPR